MKSEQLFDTDSGDLLSPETKQLIQGLGDTPESMQLKASIISAANELKRGDYDFLGIGLTLHFKHLHFKHHEMMVSLSFFELVAQMCESKRLNPSLQNLYQCIYIGLFIYHAWSSFRFGCIYGDEQGVFNICCL